MGVSKLILSLWVVMVMVSGLLVGSTSVKAQDTFVAIDADGSLLYGEQKVVLKGVNFDNANALGATHGVDGERIGSGNIDDIPIVREDYALLSSYGANVVRFGLDFAWYQADSAKFFDVLDQHVIWAKENNLWIIWNMFTTPGGCYEGYTQYCGLWTDPAEQEALQAFWVDMATHYINEVAVLGYDLLNEPTPPAPDWSKTWFDLAQTLHDAILAVDPNHLVFIQATSAIQFDRTFGVNTVYEVHMYTPLEFSHSDESDTKVYPGFAEAWDGTLLYWDKAAFASEDDPHTGLQASYQLNWAREQKVPLFVGEWGSRATYYGYDQYIRDLAELFNEWELHQTIYGWRHDSDEWKWGVFPEDGDLIPYDERKLEAMKISWAGAVQPDFGFVAPVVEVAAEATPESTDSPLAAETEEPEEVAAIEAPSQAEGTFVRGINLAGEAVAIDGNDWEAGTIPDITTIVPGDDLSWLTLVPETDEATAAMLRNSIEHWEHNISLQNVAEGTYTLYIYTIQTWENPEPAPFTIDVEGQPLLTYTHTANIEGEWVRHGPLTVEVTDGTLDITTGGLVRIAGFELWQ